MHQVYTYVYIYSIYIYIDPKFNLFALLLEHVVPGRISSWNVS